jgi:CHASE2 domain-containing sensor protein
MAVATLLGVAAGYAVWHTAGSLELQTIDARFQIRGQHAPWPGVAIVGIDATALETYGNFPFDRRLDAQLIDALVRDGARAIAFDLIFDHKTTPASDLALYQAAVRAGHRLVLAANASNGHGQTNVLGGHIDGFLVGSANFSPDAGGIIRRVPERIDGLQSFAVGTARSAGLSAARVRSLFDGGSQWIDFPGPIAMQPISFASVLEPGRFGFDPKQIRGKIVVVGATDTQLQDLHSTAGWTGAQLSGPEIEADAISTLMTGAPIRALPTALQWLELVLAALILPLLALTRRIHWSRLIIVGVLVAAAILVSAQLAFNAGVITLVVAPLAALLVSGAAAVLIPLALERRELRDLRERFARFDPTVVDAVLSDPGVTLRARAMAIGPESVVAGYRIVSLIGRGGMGVVYEALQLTLERPVALKLIDPARVDDEDLRARFVRESHIAAGLEHPHVIPVYEAREDDGILYIAMRLVRGPSLADVFAAQAPLSATRAAALVAQIASALGAAHANGLVHRDVKPANILLHDGEHAYLTDFGITRELSAGEGLTAVGERIGTVDYMSPEQARGEAVGPAADIYSLGCVLYEALTGRVPFPAGNEAMRLAAHLQEPPPIPSDHWPSVPATLDIVVLTALAKEPEHRYATADEFATAVLRAAGLEPAPPPPPKVPAAPPIALDAPTIVS